jgi:hypothetical protein
VHEDIGAAVRLRDEAEALLGIEPLDCSGSHGGLPLSSTQAMHAESHARQFDRSSRLGAGLRSPTEGDSLPGKR